MCPPRQAWCEPRGGHSASPVVCRLLRLSPSTDHVPSGERPEAPRAQEEPCRQRPRVWGPHARPGSKRKRRFWQEKKSWARLRVPERGRPSVGPHSPEQDSALRCRQASQTDTTAPSTSRLPSSVRRTERITSYRNLRGGPLTRDARSLGKLPTIHLQNLLTFPH